jgi:hypothetical protein
MKIEKKTLKHARLIIIRIGIALGLAYILQPFVVDIMAEYEDIVVLGLVFSLLQQLVLILLIFLLLQGIKFMVSSKHDATLNYISLISMRLPYLFVLTTFALFSYLTFGWWGAILGVILIELKEVFLNTEHYFKKTIK